MDTVKLMNPTMWVFASLLVIWVLVQAGLFLKLALNFNKKNRLLSSVELKDCVKIGSSAVVGPAINSIAVCLVLISMMGSADAFMRCGVIGAPVLETWMAQMAASVAGVEFGSAGFTPAIFVFCMFLQVWGTLPYFILTPIMLKPLDLAVEKAKDRTKGGPQFTSYLADSAMFGVMSYLLVSYLSSVQNVAAIGACIVCGLLVNVLIKKSGSKFLMSYYMVFCMAAGMVGGEIVNGLMM